MPELSFDGRTLVYAEFGAGRRIPGAPTILMPSTEYRDTETLVPLYSQFPVSMDIVILDNTNIGHSSRLEAPLSPDEVADEIGFVADALGVRQLVLVGYCITAELALYAARKLDAAGVILHAPMVRYPDGRFIEYLYAALKKAVFAGDAYLMSLIMNLLDPHASGFREDRSWAMLQQFANRALLQDKEHFWIKTLQCKPVGAFQWDDLPKLACPVRVIRGVHDAVQPIQWMTERLTRPNHDLIELDCSHQILNARLEDVITHMADFSAGLTAKAELAGTAAQ